MSGTNIKIYKDDELLHDCTLCKNPEGKIGWWDAVDGKFHPREEEPQTREPMWVQYIDTGVSVLRRQNVPDINDVKTIGDRIRAMTDEELVEFLFEYGAYTVCDLVCGGGCKAFASLKETSDEKCRRIILEKLRAPYKEKEHGKTIGADTEA